MDEDGTHKGDDDARTAEPPAYWGRLTGPLVPSPPGPVDGAHWAEPCNRDPGDRVPLTRRPRPAIRPRRCDPRPVAGAPVGRVAQGPERRRQVSTVPAPHPGATPGRT
jgi:hypothetical protein